MWHVAGCHRKDPRPSAAGSSGDHPRIAAGKRGVESEDRRTGTAGEGQNAAELLAAAQHATSAQPAAAAETKIQKETWRAARP